MIIGGMNIKDYSPSDSDQELRNYVQDLKSKMDTPYRMRAVRLAQWGRNDYEGTSDNKVLNMDLLKVSLSYSVVNQRLSTLYANPSRAEFKTVEEGKKNDVEILKQVDLYDKQVGRFNSSYQEIEQCANIEGSCFARVDWDEQFDEDGHTIGVPSTKLYRTRMNDFWWDYSARDAGEMNHAIERKVIGYEEFLRKYLPMEGAHGFKNIRCVQPMKSMATNSEVWEEKWEKYGRDVQGDGVTLWYFETLGMIINQKIQKKCMIIANGVVIYEKDQLAIPKLKISDPDLLSWFKVDGIPSGTMIGMGIPVLIRHPQEAFNQLLTLSVAQSQLAVSPPLFLRPEADQDLDDYPLMPGRTIPTRGSGRSISEDYQWMQVPDITSGSQKIMNDLIEYVIMLTGVDIRGLFVPASEKAITTENKREIQEKLLRFSVLWNEDHGFTDMMQRRLRLIQKNYPQKRMLLEEQNGELIEREDYLQVPLKDYETEEYESNGDKKVKLNFKKGGYTSIKITPENLKLNVDLVIEGAGTAEERDIIKKQNFIEHLKIILSVPQFAERIDPDKGLKMILKRMNIPEDTIISTEMETTNNMHPALKELAAIRMYYVLKEQGINIPQDIPEPEEYEPMEYVDIFNQFLLTEYEKLDKKQKSIFDERFNFHNGNALNPYYKELKQKQEQIAQMPQLEPGQPPTEGVSPTTLPEGTAPQSLTQQVRQKAGKLGSITM